MADAIVRESIREIDDGSWLIGNKVLLSRAPLHDCAWEDGHGGGYRISDAPFPLPRSQPLSDTSDFELLYYAGNVSIVFRIGKAVCKIRVLNIPDTTREHVTYAWLHKQKWSFTIPNVLYYAEHDGRYFIVLTRIPGATIDGLWPTWEESTRQNYVKRVVDICLELAKAAPNSNGGISGVDGGFLTELYLCGPEKDCSPENMRKSCLELGMDCSTLVFYHCDLSPTNVLIGTDGSVGIVDWETAGFVPWPWIRTKFRVSRGMNLSDGDELDFRRRVMTLMGEKGLEDVKDKFIIWRKNRYN